MRTLTASERSTLIKLASNLPKGSSERRAILASLGKVSRRDWPDHRGRNWKFKDNPSRWTWKSPSGAIIFTVKENPFSLRNPNSSGLYSLMMIHTDNGMFKYKYELEDTQDLFEAAAKSLRAFEGYDFDPDPFRLWKKI